MPLSAAEYQSPRAPGRVSGLVHLPFSGPRRRRRKSRGVTLMELMIAMALIAILVTGASIGLGALGSARLRESISLVASAVRVAYTHASATSRPTRLVFDFEKRSVSIESSEGRMFIKHGDRTGGAAAATEAEHEAVAEAEEIIEGVRPPRPQFKAVKTLGFNTPSARKLSRNIFFRQIEVGHEEDPVAEERAYLYFWPGGQTERAAIQLQQGGGDSIEDHNIMTLLVAPLTGKVSIERGPVDMLRPRTDEEESEREDSGL